MRIDLNKTFIKDFLIKNEGYLRTYKIGQTDLLLNNTTIEKLKKELKVYSNIYIFEQKDINRIFIEEEI